MRKVTFLVTLLVLAILVSACNRETPTLTPEPTATAATAATPEPTNTPEAEKEAEPTPTTAAEQPAEGASEALDVTWQWTELHDADGPSLIPDPENYTLTFHADGTVNVKADCNQGSGTYTLDGNKLTFGPLAMTLAECGPESLFDEFFETLGSVDTVAVENGRLVMNLAEGAGKMVFDKAPDTAEPAETAAPPTAAPETEDEAAAPSSELTSQIVGVIWQWTELTETDPASQQVVPDPENYVLVFQADGTVNVKADCNQGSGTYTLDGNQISFGPIAMTRAYCGDDSLDGLFLETLDAMEVAALENGSLVLTTANGSPRMVFKHCGWAKWGTKPPPPTPCPLPPPQIVGAIWQWAELHDANGQTTIPDPQNYVLVLQSNGTFTIKADCNQGSGTYTLSGDTIDLTVTQITQADCGADSMDDQYLKGLESASTFAIENGRLVLTMPDGMGKMVFNHCGWAKWGTKPPPPTPCPTTAPGATPTPCPWPTSPIVGVVWQWTEWHEPDSPIEVIPDPQNYVLVLQSNGTFTIKADCNQGSGTYTVNGDAIDLNVTQITRAECGEESLDDLFLLGLGSASTFAIENGRLVLIMPDGVGKMVFNHCGWAKVPVEPVNRLLGVLWMWERFDDQSDEGDIVVADPSLYTLELLPKGVFRIRADCNTGSGTYYLSGSQLTLTLGAITLAYCGDDSLHDRYLALLKDVVTYVLDDQGKLVLNLKADAGNMVFGQGNGAAAAPAPPPAADAGAGDGGLDASTVSLDTQALGTTWQASVVPATPYDKSQPPGPKGLPEHILITFGGTQPASKQPGDPVMYIIPVQEYRQLWEAQGDPGVSILVETQQKMLLNQPTPFPPAGIPVLPFEEIGGTNDLAVQGAYLDLPTMSGLRFVGRFSQGPNPVINEGMQYMYQGYAGDAGEYLVAFFYPASTSALPNSASEVPASEMDRLNADPGAYMQERVETLNGLAETDWEPNLSALDAVIASLSF